MNQDILYNWLMLALTPSIGPVSFLKLLKKFGSIEQIMDANVSELQTAVHLSQANAIKQKIAQPAVELSLEWANTPNCHIITLLHDNYPSTISQYTTAPPILFARGDISLLSTPMISIVGSRHPSAQGIQNAKIFAKSLSQSGLTVVSGLAAGIDTAAHEGALLGTGATIGVLGTGIDRIYPANNKELAHQMCHHGLLISEFALGTKPLASNFPRRNRLIAALGEATVVVEATIDSGSLITAQLALEMNKEVMAIPGSIHNPQSKGCHKLIKEGAKLVETLDDILEDLPNFSNLNQNTQNLVSSATLSNHNDLLVTMGFDPVHPDILAQKLNLEPTVIFEQLLLLEIEGLVQTMPGGRYQRLFSE
ncbi:DNA-processing protein DprA [Neisseria sp. Ec49-e6-T10]|uniref:DNA-processing protein DprA n=1 Tax=Neisseria sp. Ec49-e6-T10 TaxID=3140744 RepID=UPI003EBF2480